MTNEQNTWFAAVLRGLAGAHPDYQLGEMRPDQRDAKAELLRLAAEQGLRDNKEPTHAAFRAHWWLLRAFADWLIARADLDRMDAEDYDQAFERGMNFKRYLAAWLWSVGAPQLLITAADLEAVHEATGVAPLPHPLLPRHCYRFLTECFTTTKVDCIPARDLDEATVLLAFSDSQEA